MGAFPPPVKNAGDTCYISDHTDIAIGLNAKSPNADAAKTFLSWVASPDFATIYANALPGFFSLNNAPVKMEDPLAQEFVSWREKCKPTIRSTYQILSRGTPNLENETWVEVGQRDQRHRHAGGRGREAAEGPRRLVQAGEVMRRLTPRPCGECGQRRPAQPNPDEGGLESQVAPSESIPSLRTAAFARDHALPRSAGTSGRRDGSR